MHRVLFFGSDAFSVTSLQALASARSVAQHIEVGVSIERLRSVLDRALRWWCLPRGPGVRRAASSFQ